MKLGAVTYNQSSRDQASTPYTRNSPPNDQRDTIRRSRTNHRSDLKHRQSCEKHPLD